MFWGAESFNGDLSKWDVSRVTNMDQMFQYAKSFKQELCEAAWVHSKASQKLMFDGSEGSISRTVRRTAPTFCPRSTNDLRRAVGECRTSTGLSIIDYDSE